MTITDTSTDNAAAALPAFISKLAPYYLLVLAVLLAYANVYNNEFVYDDDILIVKNQFLRDWHMLGAIFSSSATGGANIPGGFYRPLQILLYFVIYQLGGLSVLGFHILNTGLHAVAACLVYALGRRLNFKSVPCFLAALVWALHPVDVEAVTYISATADPLYGCLTLASVVAALPDFSRRKIALSSAFFILALLAKETAIVLPLLVATCIYLTSPRRFNWRSYLCLWPLASIAVIYGLFRIYVMNFDHFVFYTRDDIYATSFASRLETFFATLPAYAQLLAWPTGLHLDRNFPVYSDPLDGDVLIGGLMTITGAGIALLAKSTSGRIAGWGVLWFFSAQLLHSGILKPLNSLFLEHWMYLPMVGVYLAMAQIMARMAERTGSPQPARALVAIVLSIALIFSILTYRQNRTWADSIALYRNIFDNGETSAHAFTNLGVVYTKQGQYEQALEQYRLAFASSHDNDAQPHHNYAITVLMEGNSPAHTREAIIHFKRALAIDPHFYPAAEALAALYKDLGDPQQSAYYRDLADRVHEVLAPHSGAVQPIPVQ